MAKARTVRKGESTCRLTKAERREREERIFAEQAPERERLERRGLPPKRLDCRTKGWRCNRGSKQRKYIGLGGKRVALSGQLCLSLGSFALENQLYYSDVMLCYSIKRTHLVSPITTTIVITKFSYL